MQINIQFWLLHTLRTDFPFSFSAANFSLKCHAVEVQSGLIFTTQMLPPLTGEHPTLLAALLSATTQV